MIEVCIGSACHLKGSYEVIQQFKKLIQDNGLSSQVELKSSFCLGKCGNGVSVRLHGETVHSIQPEETEQFFLEKIKR